MQLACALTVCRAKRVGYPTLLGDDMPQPRCGCKNPERIKKMQFLTDALSFFKEGALGCFGTEKTAKTVLFALGVFALLHLLTVFLPGIAGRISAYLNLLAHALGIVLFMKIGLTIYQAVLVYMASLFLYSLFNFIPFLIYKAILAREERRGER